MMDLEFLRPTSKNLVMNLLSEAGMDVSDWGNYKKGQNYASSNPKYCYEWSFIDKDRLVLNLWHENLQEENGVITCHANFRGDALENKLNNPRRGWGKRGLKIDDHIRVALRERLPVQVILLSGQRRKSNEIDAVSSNVSFRRLDTEFWTISFYANDTGNCVLTRGRFIDQFAIKLNNSHEKVERVGFVYPRSVLVRQLALTRANGKCEFCNQAGFHMMRGAIYLETHHIVPLSEGGADEVENVIALCPNHHREAHFGNQKDEMRRAFQKIISSS